MSKGTNENATVAGSFILKDPEDMLFEEWRDQISLKESDEAANSPENATGEPDATLPELEEQRDEQKNRLHR